MKERFEQAPFEESPEHDALQKESLAKREEFEELFGALEKRINESEQDPLTGLENRRGFIEKLETILNRVTLPGDEPRKNAAEPVSLMLFDIDNFKKLNDTYGHDFGDAVLKTLAKALKKTVRKTDLAGRWGGEEFIVAFENSYAEGILEKDFGAAADQEGGAGKFNLDITLEEGQKLKVTVSGGITEYIPGESIETMVKRADDALYYAKEHGRDRLMRYNETMARIKGHAKQPAIEESGEEVEKAA